MTKKEIEQLFDYDAWADVRIFEVAAALSTDQYKRDLHASFGSIHGTFVHIISANRTWLNRWTGKTPEPLIMENFQTIEIVKKQWDAYQYEISNFLQGVSEENLREPFRYSDFKGNTYAQPLFQQMLHKVNHSSYHRGQIVVLLKQLDAEVVGTDLITYLRQKDNHG
jgi:uncharacterized damage-inducible protein DinB